jgi:hypothetical protein
MDGLRMLLCALTAAAVAALAGPIAGAAAVPPPNDSPAGAAPFQPVTAANGTPHETEAFAELAEAGPDRGIDSCLGAGSFARTVWFRVPAAPVPQEITVDAIGQTLDPVDLAAFVQRTGATSPVIANACDGIGAGGSDAAEEPTSAVTLRVPANRDVLIQAGRRGPRGSADDERALLTLDAQPLEPIPGPVGDAADGAAPAASTKHGTRVRLDAATITAEDPAQPPCPSLGTVWRVVKRGTPGPRLISVEGSDASTLAVFEGRHPTGDNALDCVVRAGGGPLQMRLPLRKGRPLWIRIGADGEPDGMEATLRIQDAGDTRVIDGGPGGFDPTTGGPGGGLPAACDRARIERARISGPRIRGEVKLRNKRKTFPLKVVVRGSSICDAKLNLYGPRGHIYATARAIRLSGRKTVRLQRVRKLRKGVYRLRANALSELGGRASVRARVSGTLK